MQKRHEIDMCNGPLLSKILIFAIPLVLSGILQLLFNAADLVVVGRYSGSDALAAVGATGPITQLIIQVFMGFSVSANILVARFYGAKDPQKAALASGNAVLVSIVGGIIFGLVGFFLCRPLLLLFDTPADVVEQAVLYMRIYFCGLPVIALYNFGSAILRAVGDTTRPLIYLTIAGIINVTLNLVFTIVFDMGVAGVAIATVVSQAFSAALIMRVLVKSGSWYSLKPENMRPNKNILLQMAQIGIPSGINGSLFAISNSVIQAAINSFGANIIAGCSAASNILGFLWTGTDAFSNCALAFTSQNFGAQKYDRIKKVCLLLLCICLIICVVGGILVAIFSETLVSIYTDDPEAIAGGASKLRVNGYAYITIGLMNIMNGMVRGLGYSSLPTIVSLIGTCGLRIMWIYTVFEKYDSLMVLFACYPVSWGITGSVLFICFVIILKKLIKKRLSLAAA